MLGLSAGPKRWQRGCGSVAASSPRAWLLRRMGISPTVGKFLAGLVNFEIAFGKDNIKMQVHFLPILSKAVCAELTETLLCRST